MSSASIAVQVRDALLAAGIPVAQPFLAVSERYRVGASVEAEGNAIFVTWQADHALVERMSAALLGGRDDHPTVMHHATVVEAMSDAMAKVLSSAGFGVRPAHDEDEYRPFELRITSAPSLLNGE
jgi:hypothetical protein